MSINQESLDGAYLGTLREYRRNKVCTVMPAVFFNDAGRESQENTERLSEVYCGDQGIIVESFWFSV